MTWGYLIRFDNLEDYKMRDRPYTGKIYTNLDELMYMVKRYLVDIFDLDLEKDIFDFELPEGWNSSETSLSGIRKQIEKLGTPVFNDFDYIVYSDNCIQALWVSRCQIG